MILFCLISHQSFIKDKPQIFILKKFELLLGLALYYGIFILALPISILLYKAKEQSWFRIIETLKQPVVLSAYKMTFITACIAAIINALAGLILAWVLVRYHFYGKKILDVAIDLPFALPTSVGGLTLMTVYSDQGWMGPICSWLGVQVVFSQLGVLIAMIFVSIPFVVRTVQPVLESMEEELEEAALCVGASSWTTFWEIIFPPLAPSLVTGTALGFSRAIGEYGSITLISSNIPTKDLVISVLISQKLEQYDYQGATVIATGALFVSFILLLVINSIQVWRQTLTK
uniref:Sulfate transport system permease protein CysT n=1 Tax=Spirogyra maxima TaxID=3180 RepID=A0A191T4E7_SPIMX|nr:putative transport protein [Spirogyra maxima]ANI25264.1 putative transport protein [Spirogyra maxima]